MFGKLDSKPIEDNKRQEERRSSNKETMLNTSLLRNLSIHDECQAKISKEKIEEFGRMIDFHNQIIVDKKCRKYSIVDSDDQTSVTSKLNSNSKAEMIDKSDNKKYDLTQHRIYFNTELNLKEEEKNLFKSPQVLSSNKPKLYSKLEEPRSYQKHSIPVNPFRSRIFKTKLNFNLSPNVIGNSQVNINANINVNNCNNVKNTYENEESCEELLYSQKHMTQLNSNFININNFSGKINFNDDEDSELNDLKRNEEKSKSLNDNSLLISNILDQKPTTSHTLTQCSPNKRQVEKCVMEKRKNTFCN